MYDVPWQIDNFLLDVEDAKELIMHNFTFHMYRFSVLTVERPSAAFQDFLRHNGYHFVCNDCIRHNNPF